jgi:putative endonuclease
MWFVYIIQCKDKSLYTGITTDVAKRFLAHQHGKGGAYTASHPPRKIVYKEKASSRSLALKREAQIKKFSRKGKLELTQQ